LLADFTTGEAMCATLAWVMRLTRFAFVARPGSRDEADGWIMTPGLRRGDVARALVIPDAREINRTPVAEIVLPPTCPARAATGEWMAA
jgi:carotenoid cleavage dioxygenase-like enzyme